MKTNILPQKKKRILLAGVFGPFGVDDAYGRKENIMELFHNQVTKGQGIGSFRFHHRSFGLYFLAANVDADVTVLDFPSKRCFIREIKKGYDMVGVSFIAPNFIKAKEMARLVRLHAPRSKIILGGHGAAIEGVEQLIDCDHVAKGEGIRFLRRLLGQDPDAPIIHPILPSAERESIFGVPLFSRHASMLVPGVGCVNGCKFCSTSHFFGRSYSPFIATGKELFETACRIADARGTDDFFVMDENFLKDKARALDFLAETEKHQRFFRFQIFSSAEAITAFGVENLVRLGVRFIWIGVECKNPQENFEKNRGIDPRKLIQTLRDHGIIVLASGILCMEHHTPENIQADIDFLVGLESDFVQFMLFTPMPVTALYEDQKKRGLLRKEMPFEEWHGQKMLMFNHPHFPGDAPERWLKAAFRQDYESNGSSMLRVLETSFRGYLTLSAMKNRDACLELRRNILLQQVLDWSPMTTTIAHNAVNDAEKKRAKLLGQAIAREIGVSAIQYKLFRVAAVALTASWKLRVRLFGDGIQPATIVTHYRAKDYLKARKEAAVLLWPRPEKKSSQNQAAAAALVS